jgi:hypothetical protein
MVLFNLNWGPAIGVALGAGSLPEEVFNMCHRVDCLSLKRLRREALEEVVSSSDLLKSSAEALKRRGYAEDAEEVRAAVVKEYARVLSLDVPPREDVLQLLGGQRGWTFEDLLIYGNDPVPDKLHEAMMAFYMEYVDGGDVERLGAAEFAVYAALALLQRGRTGRTEAAEAIRRIADWVLGYEDAPPLLRPGEGGTRPGGLSLPNRDSGRHGPFYMS